MEATDISNILTPDEIKKGCCAVIPKQGGLWTYCILKPTLRLNGKIYCTTHNPLRLKKRMDDRMERERQARDDAQAQQQKRLDDLYQAGRISMAKEIVEWVESRRWEIAGNFDKPPSKTMFALKEYDWDKKVKEWLGEQK